MKAWLVNTNSNEAHHNPNGFKYMLRQNKVSAYYDKKTSVDSIGKGDLILLYHNDNRVIGVGFALSNYTGHDYDDFNEIEHSIDVNWLWKSDLNKPFNKDNYIKRKDIGFTSVRHTVNEITKEINYKSLFNEIGKKQLL